MPKLKTAETQVVAFNVTCPECREEVATVRGSLMWVPEELTGESYQCHCGQAFRLPFKVRR